MFAQCFATLKRSGPKEKKNIFISTHTHTHTWSPSFSMQKSILTTVSEESFRRGIKRERRRPPPQGPHYTCIKPPMFMCRAALEGGMERRDNRGKVKVGKIKFKRELEDARRSLSKIISNSITVNHTFNNYGSFRKAASSNLLYQTCFINSHFITLQNFMDENARLDNYM